MASFDRKSGSIGVKRPINPEVVVFTGEEVKTVTQAPGPTASHKNYGKVPQYLNKYKVEAADLAKKREDIRLKRAMPAGMIQMPEAERIQTLEQLESTKRELQSILGGLPISMRSDNLRERKRELEQRLDQLDKNITTFSRKVVYIQE